MANRQEIGRDDWIRTSDPLNPIQETDEDVTDCYGWRSASDAWKREAYSEANANTNWPLWVIVFCAAALIGVIAYQSDLAVIHAIVARLTH